MITEGLIECDTNKLPCSWNIYLVHRHDFLCCVTQIRKMTFQSRSLRCPHSRLERAQITDNIPLLADTESGFQYFLQRSISI